MENDETVDIEAAFVFIDETVDMETVLVFTDDTVFMDEIVFVSLTDEDQVEDEMTAEATSSSDLDVSGGIMTSSSAKLVNGESVIGLGVPLEAQVMVMLGMIRRCRGSSMRDGDGQEVDKSISSATRDLPSASLPSTTDLFPLPAAFADTAALLSTLPSTNGMLNWKGCDCPAMTKFGVKAVLRAFVGAVSLRMNCPMIGPWFDVLAPLPVFCCRQET